MYGGGFATIPAYLADMFGTQFVGAIHGRLLTAWSTAGIVGPVIVNYLHDQRQAEGVAPDQIYGPIFYILAGLLVVGFLANLLVRPVNPKWHMSEAEVAAENAKLKAAPTGAATRRQRHRHGRRRFQVDAVLAVRRHPAGVGYLEHGREGAGAVPLRRRAAAEGSARCRRLGGSRPQCVQRPMRPYLKLSAYDLRIILRGAGSNT